MMKKEQQFWHVVSVLVAVFLVLLFYLLGGGTANHATLTTQQESSGINLEVPAPDADELSANRLEAVLRKVEAESLEKRSQQIQHASSFQWLTSQRDSQPPQTPAPACAQSTAKSRPCTTSASTILPVAPEPDRQQFIAAKRKQLAQKYGIPLADETPPPTPVQAVPHEEPKATVATPSAPGFYGIEQPTQPSTDIRAVVHGEHRNLQRGAIVKLRLLDAIVINGTTIPANTFLYGQLSLASCRAIIRIQNVQYRQVVYPFKGTIYDSDGFEGLYVPDNRVDEAARKAGSQALGNANLRIPSVSFIASAANAAVSAVQSVAQQSISEQKISISSNYLVTIKQSTP